MSSALTEGVVRATAAVVPVGVYSLLNGGSFLSLHENVLANAGTLHG